MQTRFNSPDEFIDEMKKDNIKGIIERDIVRITNLFTPSKLSPNIHHLQVVATYAITLTKTNIRSIVKLEVYCGDLWGLGHDEEKQQKADVIIARISAIAEEIGLDVRSGMIEEDK